MENGEVANVTGRPAHKNRRLWILILVFILLLGVSGVIQLVCVRNHASYSPPPVSFDGSSDQLQATAIVPTLDTPCPAGKNVVWCASFQMAWDRLRSDLIKEPLLVANAQPIADRLNASTMPVSDLPAGSYYAAAGKGGDGVVSRVNHEMAAKFPRVGVLPLADVGPKDLLAYAYLQANVKFTVPYFNSEKPQAFTDSTGRRTSVSAFGLFPHEADVNEELARQIEVLYAKEDGERYELTEFALDLCKTSSPSQIILACVPRKETLAATVAYLEEKIAAGGTEVTFGSHTPLVVPNLNWKVLHHFAELEGTDKALQNPAWKGYFLRTSLQQVEFRLDRSGAAMASQSKIVAAKALVASRFRFLDPFLIVMKVRGAKHPYFVLWVDNAELLCKHEVRETR